MMELEDGSTPANPRVGLWAKAYMTSEKYEYLGTLMTKESLDAVIRGTAPPMQARDVAECKTSREANCIHKLNLLSKGQYAKQFPPERVADAIAMSERNWDHFRTSSGALHPSLQRLPHELAAELQRCGLRHVAGVVPEVPEVQAERQEAALFLTRPINALPPALRQYKHAAADLYASRFSGAPGCCTKDPDVSGGLLG